jgi:hypothetical protein
MVSIFRRVTFRVKPALFVFAVWIYVFLTVAESTGQTRSVPRSASGPDFDAGLIIHHLFDNERYARIGPDIYRDNTRFTTDRFGNAKYALLGDGFSNTVSLETDSLFTGANAGSFTGNAYTISFWISLQTKDLGYLVSSFSSMQLYQAGNDIIFFPNNGATGQHAVKATVTPGNWHHIVLTYQSGVGIMYLDGAAQIQVPFSNGNSFLNKLQLGGFDGAMDDFRVYDYDLSAEDIAALHVLEQTEVYTSGLMPQPAATNAMWTARLRFVQGTAFSDVFIGNHPDATDGFDMNHDLAEPPAAPGQVIRAYMERPEWNSGIGDTYIKDIRAGASSPAVFTVHVQVPSAGNALLILDRPRGYSRAIRIQKDGYSSINSSGVYLQALYFSQAGTHTIEVETGYTVIPPSPVLIPGNHLQGPGVLSQQLTYELSWTQNGTDDIVYTDSAFFSIDGGTQWHPIAAAFPKRTAQVTSSGEAYLSVPFSVPAWFGPREKVLFRVTSTDSFNQTSHWTSPEPIVFAAQKQPVPLIQGWNLVGASMTELLSQHNASAQRFAWTGQQYSQVPGYDLQGAHWAGAPEPAADTLTGYFRTGYKADLKEQQAFPSGWHTFKLPFLADMRADSLRFSTPSEPDVLLTLQEAKAQALLAAVYAFNPATGYEHATVLKPNAGYWLGAFTAVTVHFSVHSGLETVPKVAEQPPVFTSTITDSGRSTTFTLGGESAIPAPPPAPKAYPLGFSGPDNGLGSRYLSQPFAFLDGISEHHFSESGPARDLTIARAGDVDSGLECFILLPGGQEVLLSPAASITWNTAGGMPVLRVKQVTTAAHSAAYPDGITLHPNVPNPFNPTTTLSFELPSAQLATLQVFDTNGRLIETLADGVVSAGTHRLSWNASRFASGVYVVRLRTAGSVLTRKMMLLK